MVLDDKTAIRFSGGKEGLTAYLPQQVTAAKYLINLSILRAHSLAGITLQGKNHFGSIHFPNNGGWTPAPLHSYVSTRNAMGTYNALVDLMGHRHLGGKTLLFMIDGLYATEYAERQGLPVRVDGRRLDVEHPDVAGSGGDGFGRIRHPEERAEGHPRPGHPG